MKPQREGRSLGDDPLAGEAVLERFYKPVVTLTDASAPGPGFAGEPDDRGEAPDDARGTRPAKATLPKPTHYKVVCISLYTEDIAHLEEMVAELKRRGHTKANKSQLIRAALAQVDLTKIPKGF